MKTRESIPVIGEPEGVPSHSGLDRFAAIAEVVLAFALVHVAYRAVKRFPLWGQWDAQTNFIPGLVMVAFTVAVLVLCRRSFVAYGLSSNRWSYHLSLGLACSLVLLAVEAIALGVTRVHIDASRPPDPHAPLQFVRVAELAAVALP